MFTIVVLLTEMCIGRYCIIVLGLPRLVVPTVAAQDATVVAAAFIAGELL